MSEESTTPDEEELAAPLRAHLLATEAVFPVRSGQREPEQERAAVWHLRGGRVIKHFVGRDRDRALADLGLEE